MIEQSLIENIEHDDISDYEKALVFERMSREMNKTYDDIGKMIGSRSSMFATTSQC